MKSISRPTETPRKLVLTPEQERTFLYGKQAAYKELMEELAPQLKGGRPVELINTARMSLEVVYPSH